ncbi:MAG: hypothetical protein AUJ55_05665 [Proteobacteria bacterium CG1_02_64_396]|nr:MAG: hypothetical protein AUJ55_05665 [Proteobacteria bacterium CG1_02_64_396]
MRFRVLTVGKGQAAFLAPAWQEYRQRLDRSFPTQWLEIPETPLRKGTDPDAAMRQEGERILEKLASSGPVVLFDRQGKGIDSVALAEQIGRWRDGGIREVSWIIGGPNGVDGAVAARADLSLSFGPITLPHPLMRVVLAEQLYRASTILRGEPYHR